MKPYPFYRPTSLFWIRQLPTHWHQHRIGFLFTERREKVSDSDFAPLSVTMNGIVPQIETAAKTDDGDNRKLVRAGDFVINSRSDRKGSSGLSSLDGSVSLISIVLTSKGQISGAFAHHLLRSQAFQEEFYRNGQGIVADLWSTPFSRMRDIVLPLPSLEEQHLIASFLDRETAEIDALTAEQERLIALLQEKRQAVISHAVTKGLDPNVPMKDSGVEWLGDVPAHWEVRPLKHLTSFATGWTPPTGREEYYGGEHFWANISDLGPKHLHSTEKTVTDVAVREARLKVVPRGSLLFSFKLSVGQVSLTAAEMYTNEAIAAFVPSKRMDTHYLYWAAPLLLPKNAQENIYGAPLLSRERIANALVLSLPLEEQYAIATFLDRETARVDALISDAASVIALLQERRTALITAAVTGQIDVRGLVETAA